MIFPFLWNLIPGPAWIKVFAILVLIAGIISVTFDIVFPWLADTWLAPEATVDQGP